MAEEKHSPGEVWAFNGTRNHFPGAVFTSRSLAEAWIEKHKLQGTLPVIYPGHRALAPWRR